jgi:copper chaperone
VKSVILKIDGMHCDCCAFTVKTLLEREAGVKTATVSFKDGDARIVYDAETTDEDRLAAAVEHPGYRVTGRAS